MNSCTFFLQNFDDLLGRKIEFKQDGKSKYTRNFYFEFEQISKNTDWHVSGHVKAMKEGCILVVSQSRGGPQLAMDYNRWLQCIDGQSFRVGQTAPYKNGNKEGMFTRGYMVPVEHFMKFAVFL